MARLEEKRIQFQAQITELYRLAEEAAACAKLLRDQAQAHEELLNREDLSEEQLDRLLAEPRKEIGRFRASFSLTEGLM